MDAINYPGIQEQTGEVFRGIPERRRNRNEVNYASLRRLSSTPSDPQVTYVLRIVADSSGEKTDCIPRVSTPPTDLAKIERLECSKTNGLAKT